MKTLRMRCVSLFLALLIVAGALPGSAQASGAQTGTRASSVQESSAAAPPATFDVYVTVEGFSSGEAVHFRTFTGNEMRQLAKDEGGETLYYTAACMEGLGGRVVQEYVTVSSFIAELGIDFSSGDYLIMGPDYTSDPLYADYYDADPEGPYSYENYWKNWGWNSYDDLYEERYYFRNWDPNDAVKVPAVIALRSYGGTGWTSETYWDMYASSADYLWAYVVNFGQLTPDESTYNRFYRCVEECTFRYAADADANGTILSLYDQTLAQSKLLLEETLIGKSADAVAEGSFWVTAAAYGELLAAVETAEAAPCTTNKEAFSAYLALKSAVGRFESLRRLGTKVGYTWYDEDAPKESYYIGSVNQLAELMQIVNGTGVSGERMLVQNSFAGVTFYLTNDIDLDRYSIVIGTEQTPFSGCFDGCGHTLSNLRVCSDQNDCALFGVLSETGCVKNLTVAGSVSSEGHTVAGIVAKNYGTVTNCHSDVDVSGNAPTGSIVAENNGTVENGTFGPTPTEPDGPTPAEPDPMPAAGLPFTDVSEAMWYYDAVSYVYERGLFNGTSDQEFSPELTMDRAMLATLLCRYAGGTSSAAAPFTDVFNSAYYTEAVAWCWENHVMIGIGDNRFAPQQALSREQLVTVLYRYADSIGAAGADRADLSGYLDAAQISSYARQAMCWAVAAGVIQGVSTDRLAPQQMATRAQVATIFMRFDQLITAG